MVTLAISVMVLTIAVYAIIVGYGRAEARQVGVWRNQMDRAFLAYRSEVLNEKDAFDPAIVTIIERREVVLRGDGAALGLEVTWYVLNPSGEYYMFMHSTYRDRPYVKHMPHNVAKVVLGDKYVAQGG